MTHFGYPFLTHSQVVLSAQVGGAVLGLLMGGRLDFGSTLEAYPGAGGPLNGASCGQVNSSGCTLRENHRLWVKANGTILG